MLPLLPSVPVEVLNTIVPLVVVVLPLSTRHDSIVLLVASFRKVNVGLLVLVLRSSKNCPLPATRPSNVTRSAPFKRIIPFATEPEIVRSEPLEEIVTV